LAKLINVKIIILTPVFNSISLLKETVHSVISQKNKSGYQLDYIICDGGSDDGTVEFLENFTNENSKGNVNILFFSEKDNGMYHALVKGFIKAGNNYDIYGYLNAGDLYSVDCFDILCEVFSKDVNWITGLNVKYNKSGRLFVAEQPRDYDKNLILQGFYGTFLPFIQQESTFWNNKMHGYLNLDVLATFKYAGDYFLWHTFAKHCNILIVKEWLGGFRIHDNQMSHVFWSQYKLEYNSIRDDRSILSFVKMLLLRISNFLPKRFKKIASCF
jgi:glycosyltransferase involved in cell wall biosynthesis